MSMLDCPRLTTDWVSNNTLLDSLCINKKNTNYPTAKKTPSSKKFKKTHFWTRSVTQRGREKGGAWEGEGGRFWREKLFQTSKTVTGSIHTRFCLLFNKAKKKGSTKRRHSQWYFEANMFENKTKQMKVHSWKGATI